MVRAGGQCPPYGVVGPTESADMPVARVVASVVRQSSADSAHRAYDRERAPVKSADRARSSPIRLPE